MSRATVYEVRCPNCQTSFAPETRRCVHCGGPLGRGRIFASAPDSAPREARGPFAEAGREEEEAELAGRVRNPLWIVAAVMAVAASMIRTCSG